MKTKKLVKGFASLLGLLILAYLTYQAYMILYPQYRTETAMVANISDSVSCRGIVVRDETVIEGWGGSARSYLVDDGSKVAKDETVAIVYAGVSEDAVNVMRLSNLDEELAIVKASADSSRSMSTSVSNIRNNIYGCLTDISTAVSSGGFDRAHELKLELLRFMNSYALAVDETTDFSARIDELSALVDSITISDNDQKLTAPTEGYFISYIDGMEEKINRESVLGLSPAEVETLSHSKPENDNSGCKIVSGYTWDFAAVVELASAGDFWVGRTVTLDFRYSGINNIPAEVSAVVTSPDSEKVVVVLTCNRMNSTLASLRCEQVEIRFFDYQGIKISRSALRVEEGVVGVYVKYGTSVIFKEISVIYETDEYIVSEAGTVGSSHIAMYDEIIVQGKDFYVGKEL